MPPKPPVKRISATPRAMNATANTCPTAAAQRVARTTSCVSRQSSARSTRPPSSGNPGRRLKTSSVRLATPRYVSTATSWSGPLMR